MTREVYCPKCGQTFDEGSRRFCPTDGARLISDSVEAAAAHGVFAGIFAKKEPVREEPKPAPEPFFTLDLDDDTRDEGEPFFGLEQPPAPAEPDLFKQPEPSTIFTPPAKPLGRKVNPLDIPKGHVDLGDGERSAGTFSDFNPDDPESFVGRTVKGRYQVSEFLGGDETGLAYLADDRIADRKVLVRILLDHGSDAIMSSILAEERVSLSHFAHPNIARVIDSGAFTNGTEFLVSEFVDALSVRDVLGIHGHFPTQRAARVIKQAAYALSEAHQEGIIHRDLRPENLILDVTDTETDHLKLVNFGASSGEPNERNAAYKAPEVLDGRVPTAASDVYSLAVIAYEMLTGEPPFAAATAKEQLRAQYGGPPANSELPPVVAEVLDKAMSFKAAGRYGKAREFGDAFASALTESPAIEAVEESLAESVPVTPFPETAPTHARTVEVIKPIEPRVPEPAWKGRSSEPPQEEASRSRWITLAGVAGLLLLLGAGWYYLVNNPGQPGVQAPAVSGNVSDAPATPTISSDVELPPQSRKIPQPPNTDFYQNSRANLKGDLLRNFVGFMLYYPRDWKVNGPREGTTANARGKFLDVSRTTPDGQLREQMLISYYPSKGTFTADAASFGQMVKETNDTLKKILPGYQMVSEGEIKVNGEWRAYELKFQGEAPGPNGEKLMVWGRRLFIPAARMGVRNGFEITMLATSLADGVKSVDDVGVRGELAPILYSFEPSQNF